MITARIHRDEDDEDGVLVQLMTVPRIGETISVPDAEGQERDIKVVSVNHWIKSVPRHRQQHLQQVEVVILTGPADGF